MRGDHNVCDADIVHNGGRRQPGIFEKMAKENLTCSTPAFTKIMTHCKEVFNSELARIQSF